MNKEITEYLIELSRCYDLTEEEINEFSKMCTEKDENYILNLLGQCTKWLLYLDHPSGKYQERTKRDELKVVARVKKRIKNDS